MSRVMIVDDEIAVLRLMTVLLRCAGLNPHPFGDPAAALRAFAGEPQAYDLLVTDVTMAEMSGTELANLVLQIRPNLPVLFVSGYACPDDISHSDLLSRFQVLRKPDQIQMLKTAAWGLMRHH